MAVVLMTKIKTLSLLKFKVLFLSLFLGFFLIGCGGAQVPEITAQPKSKLATANSEFTLQVTAQVTDGGVLTYQWYSNTKNSTEGGTAIEGENSDVFKSIAPSDGFAYYYVVVTNINADLTSYANVTSDVAVITVVDYAVHEVSFYDEDLKLLSVETVSDGETISPTDFYSKPLYQVNSAEAVEELRVDSDTALFAVANVVGISNRAGLEAIKSNLDGRYVLEADIDLSDADWTPIGNKANPFTGRFSGKAHKIKGLTINSPSTDYVGLFGYVRGGNVLALRLTLGNNGIKGDNYVGGIAGYAVRSTITAVTVNGDIKGSSYIGGIAGAVNVGTITATSSATNVEATGNYVGGVTGDITLGTITATYTRGDITSLNGKYVGGVAGYSEFSTITATFGYGKVTGDKYVGGVVGYLRFGTVVASFLHGRAYGNDNVDGITGRNFLGIVLASLADGLGRLV
ncbi:MAG: hypothetical protein LBF12_01630 [Christensenellaceae bacterium]|jgi:hypothetical protein|nr:hypothetical protein [Christensenellaceae bacterium]